MDAARKSRQELLANFTASFATGTIASSFANPVDTLKCRWQVSTGPSSRSLRSFAFEIVSKEGVWRGLWRPGLTSNQMAMGLAIGFRNGLYPTIRDTLWCLEGALWPSAPGAAAAKVGPSAMFFSGLLAGMLGYFCASPLLLVKTQMQAEAGRIGADGRYETGVRAGQPPSYRSGRQAISAVATAGASDGRGVSGALHALWRGAGVIVGRGATLSASQLAAYDSVKTNLKRRGAIGDGPALHCVASLVAAGCCTTCSMPMDVVLTVYQSAHSLGGERMEKYGRSGPMACARTMLRESGPLVFMRGWVPAFLRLAPTSVFSFALYEQLRKLVGIGFLD
mmetsp:Transcript_127164/g.365738  ORF Transcript_127164/g.365738 Transcript_127164/m.365738 type:complete len:337 (-) Transcript_127164:91-1101(-)